MILNDKHVNEFSVQFILCSGEQSALTIVILGYMPEFNSF